MLYCIIILLFGYLAIGVIVLHIAITTQKDKRVRRWIWLVPFWPVLSFFYFFEMVSDIWKAKW